MTYFLKCLGDEIFGLASLALLAFLLWGAGYLIVYLDNRTERDYNTCIAAGMEWSNGNCKK